MSSDATYDRPEVFPFRDGRGSIALHASGLRHPRFPRFLGDTFTAYEDVTHHAVTSRAYRLATRRSVYLFPRPAFADPNAPDELARSLVERIGRLPDGTAQLDRMWRAEKLAASARPVRAAPAVTLVCLGVFVLQIASLPLVDYAGFFSTTLVRAGEVWRLVTANFLHSGAVHLALNGLGLLVLGAILERALGTTRTLLVLGASALGATGIGLVAGYEQMVGASGIVSGIVGALVWLEFRCTDRLPAGWRLPRDLLLLALAADAALSFMPHIAGLAHAGGFVAGGLACALVAGSALDRKPAGLPTQILAAGVLAVTVTSVSILGWTAVGGGHVFARRVVALLERPDVSPLVLNDFAWMIATDPRSSHDDLDVAVRLAKRAVRDSGARDPNILDTLAEALFQQGDAGGAVDTIDRAIALAPREPYFREQRRRFTGEREPADRPEPPPAPPGGPPPPRRPPPPQLEPSPDAIPI